MANRCLICGREIETGLTCERCDRKPAKAKSQTDRAAESYPRPAAVADFPAHATSLPLRSISELLGATGNAVILISRERAIRLVTPMARRFLGAENLRSLTLEEVESRLGQTLPSLDQNVSSQISMGSNRFTLWIVPLESGQQGAALVLQPRIRSGPSKSTLATAADSIRALRDALNDAQERKPDPILGDASSTLASVQAMLEREEEEEPPEELGETTTPVTEIVEELSARFKAIAELKSIRLQTDMKEIEGTIAGAPQLFDALSILVENSLHYVRQRGTIVAGARIKELRGRKTAVFFVMDSGPVISEENAREIFSPGFQWNSSDPERTGRDLFRCQEIAAGLGGKCWVESKDGKTCTFFISARVTE